MSQSQERRVSELEDRTGVRPVKYVVDWTEYGEERPEPGPDVIMVYWPEDLDRMQREGETGAKLDTSDGLSLTWPDGSEASLP